MNTLNGPSPSAPTPLQEAASFGGHSIESSGRFNPLAHNGLTPESCCGASLAEAYGRVRDFTLKLTASLAPEDTVIQTMPDVSPTKWHLAHTSWFFETFILGERVPGYAPFHPLFNYLFNSYYNCVGAQWPRHRRGELSHPTLDMVKAYRAHVDGAMEAYLKGLDADAAAALEPVLVLGLNHEQQHQELILTDIKHVFAQNPLYPSLRGALPPSQSETPPLTFLPFEGGLVELGRPCEGPFCFDNEGPQHKTFLQPFELANRPVTSGEFLAFMKAGGYTTSTLWLSEGWDLIGREGIRAPMYWFEKEGAWWELTLGGPRRVDLAAPVCHISLFEAEAYAAWAGARLPTEAEWEIAARMHSDAPRGAFADGGDFHPRGHYGPASGMSQLLGGVWEWTQSPYTPYPGFKAAPGALGEYNGKFMCNQMVLRGGSCATSEDHIRPTYRNFFPPGARWQFAGVRLARTLS